MKTRPIAGLLLATLAAAGPLGARSPADATWLRELGDWRVARVESLRSADGWLTLVGLFWLHEGASRFGSHLANEAVLAGAPPLVGTFTVAEGKVAFAAAEGVEVTAEGRRVGRLDLATDAGGKPTVLAHRSLRFHLISRGGRLGLRVRDTEAPARRALTHLDQFPADPSYRVAARLDPAPPGSTVEIPNVLGQLEPTPTPGHLVFRLAGSELRLVALGPPDTERLFLVFGDRTNGHETYGGGRFLYVPAPGADGLTVIDFNRSENPPCAFTPYATCPLPPRENRLPIRIEAGEKKYDKGH